MIRYTLEQIEAVLGSAPPTDVEADGFKIPEHIGQGDRHETIYKFLRSQKARGASLEVALAGCHQLNKSQCKPPIEHGELDAYLRRVWTQDDSPAFEEQKKFKRKDGKDGKLGPIIANDQANIRLAFKILDIAVSHDIFSDRFNISYNGYKGSLQDQVRNRVWFRLDEKFHFRPEQTYYRIAVDDLAYQNPYHPVRSYLNALIWDGVPRINRWLIDGAQAADTQYVQAVSAMVLIAAVKRVQQPGCKFDEMLVLESGTQGLFKSSALRALCADESWFSDDLPLNVDAQRLIERTSGKWIIEASELSGMQASKVEHLKSMLSRQSDGPVRMAYAHSPVEQPRRFIIIGTTNSHEYLHDTTGNRRFWPVRIEKFNVAFIRQNRDQMWAEAAHREAAGESIRLPEALYPHAELQQERRRQADSWEGDIAAEFEEDYQRIIPSDVWKIVGVTIDRRDARGQKRISAIMQRLGFKRQSVRDPAGKVVMGWARGKKLQSDD
mgnify:CR=1 FL=1